MSKEEKLVQLSEDTVHIGALVKLNEGRIIENQRGEHLEKYRAIEPKIISHIQIRYHKWMDRLNIQCLVGNCWFGDSELIVVKVSNFKNK